MTRMPEPPSFRPPRRIPLAFLILLLFAFLLLLLVIPSNAEMPANSDQEPNPLPPDDIDDDTGQPNLSTVSVPGQATCRRAA